MTYEIAVSRVFPARKPGAGRSVHAPAHPSPDCRSRGNDPGYLESTYAVLADYRNGHRRILPARFFSELRVLDGGWGEGTEYELSTKGLGRRRHIWAVVTEPEPGRVLVETDLRSGEEIRYELREEGANVRATIRARLERRAGIPGLGERLLARLHLRRVFRAELRLLERAVRGSEVGGRGSGPAGGGQRRWRNVKRPPELSPSAVSRFVEAP